MRLSSLELGWLEKLCEVLDPESILFAASEYDEDAAEPTAAAIGT